jgi:hypothetical protein
MATQLDADARTRSRRQRPAREDAAHRQPSPR